MKKTQFNALLLWGSLLLNLASCRQKENLPVYQVPADVEPYVQAFLTEARARGKNIQITNLIVEIADKDTVGLCGLCRQVVGDQSHQKRIFIFRDCWTGVTSEDREALVFHELGHCVLGRINHKNTQLPNGDFASLMNTSAINLYRQCVYGLGIDQSTCDKRFKRSYYIDELFDENTPVPDWAQ
jgi:hypothetical protein